MIKVNRNFVKSKRVIVIFSLLSVLFVLSGLIVPASADSITIDFEGFTLGSPNSQDGWQSTGSIAPTGLDHRIVDNTGAPYSYPTFGSQSLRISNAVTSGAFGNQTFSRSLVDESGETGANNAGYSGGVRQPYFTAQWDFASTMSAQQPGLVVAISADRGDGARQTWIGLTDTAGGLEVSFIDYPNGDASTWDTSVIASGLSRTQAHTVRMTVASIEGPTTYTDGPNDIVCIWVNGAFAYQGTTWETYHRAVSTPQTNVTIDSLLFRTSGTAAPANAGYGLLFDNIQQTSGPIPAGLETGCTPVVTTPEVTPEITPEVTTEVTPVVTPEVTPVAPTSPAPGVAAVPTAQPLPLCALFGGGTNPIVRANANPYQFCRILVENSQYIQIGAEIGDVNLINLGVIQAVDIFEFTSGGQQIIHFSQPLTVCLQGTGFMYYRDATGQPRTTAMLSSWQEGNYTCATIPNAGTVVLTGRS